MATWTLLRAFFNPRLVVPAVRVSSIRQLDFGALKRAGYKGAVFDKDNCLTRPHKDTLVPQLQNAWQECLKTFGRENVVIVSNATGTRSDPGNLEAESVAHHLGVSVLAHTTKKPGCSSTIIDYFAHRHPRLVAASLSSPSTLPRLSRSPHMVNTAADTSSHHTPLSPASIKPSELIVVGDRVFTDVILGNRLGALSIWTTGLWERELMPMRYLEYTIVGTLDRWNNRAYYIGRIRTIWRSMRMRFSSRGNKAINSTPTLTVLETEPPAQTIPIKPTPQQLFVRVPSPLTQKVEPSKLMRILSIVGIGLRLSYRGTRSAIVWTITRVRQYRKQSSLTPGEKASLAPVSSGPLYARVLTTTGSIARGLGARFITLVMRGVRQIVGEQRLLQVSTRFRQLSSRLAMIGRRLSRTWPQSQLKRQS